VSLKFSTLVAESNNGYSKQPLWHLLSEWAGQDRKLVFLGSRCWFGLPIYKSSILRPPPSVDQDMTAGDDASILGTRRMAGGSAAYRPPDVRPAPTLDQLTSMRQSNTLGRPADRGVTLPSTRRVNSFNSTFTTNGAGAPHFTESAYSQGSTMSPGGSQDYFHGLSNSCFRPSNMDSSAILATYQIPYSQGSAMAARRSPDSSHGSFFFSKALSSAAVPTAHRNSFLQTKTLPTGHTQALAYHLPPSSRNTSLTSANTASTPLPANYVPIAQFMAQQIQQMPAQPCNICLKQKLEVCTQ